MKKNNQKEILFSIAKVFIAAGLIFWIFKKIDLNSVKNLFVSANWIYLVLQLLVITVGVIVSSLKWKAILDFYHVYFRLSKLIISYWIGSFLNSFLPTSIGGDVYKYHVLGRKKPEEKLKIASSIIIERGIGFLTLFFVMVISLFFFPNSSNLIFLFALLLSVLSISGIIYFLILSKRKYKIKKNSRFKLINYFYQFCNHILEISDKNLLAYTFFLSLVFVGLSVISSQLSFLIVGYRMPLIYFLIAVPIINFSKLIPFSIDSIGIREATGVMIFSFFGVPSEVTLTAMIVGRVSSYLFSLSGGIMYLIRKFTKII